MTASIMHPPDHFVHQTFTLESRRFLQMHTSSPLSARLSALNSHSRTRKTISSTFQTPSILTAAAS